MFVGKRHILNMIELFRTREKDFQFFAKHNQLKYNIVRVKAEKYISEFRKFKDSFRLIRTC